MQHSLEHFCVPRRELVETCVEQLVGAPDKGGHYFTMWAPRQTGKTWLMRQAKKEIESRYADRFIVGAMSVQGVLGADSPRRSPFNVQRSLHVPNFSDDEVAELFRQYQAESGQEAQPAVVGEVLRVTRGQPGLIGWFGELLTELRPPLLDSRA